MRTFPSVPEPPPRSGGIPIIPHLVEFLRRRNRANIVQLVLERDAYGRDKYGQELQTGDGRSEEDLRRELGDAHTYAYKLRMEGKDLSWVEEYLDSLRDIIYEPKLPPV